MQVEICSSQSSTAADSPSMAMASGRLDLAVDVDVPARVELGDTTTTASSADASTSSPAADAGSEPVSISQGTRPTVGLGFPIAAALAVAWLASGLL